MWLGGVIGGVGVCNKGEFWQCSQDSEALQQVETAIVEQVGGALRALLQHVVLADDLHCLVVGAKPAIETDVEDVCGVVATSGAVPMVIDDLGGQAKEHVGNLDLQKDVFTFHSHPTVAEA